MFRQVIEQYLSRITHDEEQALRIWLPGDGVAPVVADPEINFGRP